MTQRAASLWPWLTALVVVIGIGLAVRVSLLERHFTHVDDLHVAATLIRLELYGAELDAERQATLSGLLDGTRGSAIEQRLVRRLHGLGLLPATVRVWKFWAHLHAVPRATTYAPAQFYVTARLVGASQSYARVKVMGRLPSLVFGALAVIVVAGVLYISSPPGWRRDSALLGAMLVSLSWQCVIYSAQMESYAIGVFAVGLLLYLLHHTLSRPALGTGAAVRLGVVLAILAMMQYQVLFLLPAFYAAAAFGRRRRESWRRLMAAGIAASAGFGLLAIPFVLPMLAHLGGAGVNWNAGPSNEFVLTAADGVRGILTFFVRNGPLVVISMLSPVREASSWVTPLAVLLVGLMMIGVFALARSPRLEEQAQLVFIGVAGLVWLALLFAGRITFGPTRHSMALIPLFVVLVAAGGVELLRRFPAAAVRARIGVHPATVVCAAAWTTLFLMAAPSEVAARTDTLTERTFAARLSADRVDAVVPYGWSEAPFLMPAVRDHYPVLYVAGSDAGGLVLRSRGRSDAHLKGRSGLILAFYSHRQPFAAGAHEAFLRAIARRYGMPERATTAILREDRLDSSTEVDWSSATRNGANGYYYTLVHISG